MKITIFKIKVIEKDSLEDFITAYPKGFKMYQGNPTHGF